MTSVQTPGGKSIHIAEKLNGTGMVEARDLSEGKVALIEENIARCSCPISGQSSGTPRFWMRRHRRAQIL